VFVIWMLFYFYFVCIEDSNASKTLGFVHVVITRVSHGVRLTLLKFTEHSNALGERRYQLA
jgi:hypothetical protein